MLIEVIGALGNVLYGESPTPEDTDHSQTDSEDAAGSQSDERSDGSSGAISLTKDEYNQLLRLANLGPSIQSERDKLRDVTVPKLEEELKQLRTQVEQQSSLPKTTPVEELLNKTKKPARSDSVFEEEDYETSIEPEALIKAILDTQDMKFQEQKQEIQNLVSEAIENTRNEITQTTQATFNERDTKTAIEQSMEQFTSKLAEEYGADEKTMGQYRELLETRRAVRDDMMEETHPQKRGEMYQQLVALEEEIRKVERKVEQEKAEREAAEKEKTELPESSAAPKYGQELELEEPNEGETEGQRNLRLALEAVEKARSYR